MRKKRRQKNTPNAGMLAKNPPKQKQFSRVMTLTNSHRIRKLPAAHPVDKSKIKHILGYIKISMLHMQRKYAPVPLVTG